MGTPHPGPGGTLLGGTLPGYPARGTPLSWPGGYPARGYPTWVPPILTWVPPLDLAGYPPRCLPHGILGNVAKHYGIRVPPQCLPHGILGNVAKHHGIWVPPPPQCLPHGILGNVAKHYGIWVPPPPCGQTEGQTRVKTLPSRRTTYAGGNKEYEMFVLYF